MKETNALRLASSLPLISPRLLKREFPITEESVRTVIEARETIHRILEREDRRLLAVVGPCSIHDTGSALEYASRLASLRKRVEDRIYIVMRVYFEKPRTTIGWRGLITDPDLDGSYDIARGLRIARKLLIDITSMGVPVGSEMLDPIVPQYISDLISWAAIGARTTESQIHREMASGLSMPVGFKNGTSGNLTLAVDALKSTKHPHCFIGIDQDGNTCIMVTKGNEDCHIILRGGRSGPNYHEENIEEAEALLRQENLRPVIMVDCSHANSGKQFAKQERVLSSVIEQKKRHTDSLIGFMIESNLHEGSQPILADKSAMRYGVSVTDECVGWEATERMVLKAHGSLG
jgi:3-deoxy-7-phosphoheptulonate synthase